MELRDYLQGLRRYWAAVVLLTLVGVGVAWGWTLTQRPVYEASSSAYIAVVAEADSVIPGQGNALTRSYVASFMDLAGWRSVAETAIAELGLETTPEALITQVTVTNPPDTTILRIQARAGSAQDAADLADAWIVGLQATIDQVDGTGEPGSAPVNVFLGDPAVAPSNPIYPDVPTALAVGGVIGFGFGIAFALIRTASDRRIRSSDAVDDKLALPVVGTLPFLESEDSRRKGRGKADKHEQFAYVEALRALRTNLQFMDVDDPPRTIVITSPLPGDGKSKTACELAKALAASGSPVILVDGDLRRSKVAKNMGLPGGAGLTDVLAGRVALEDVLQSVAASPNLLVLTAGTTPPNPSEVLGSARMHALLEDLSATALVVVDAPPLLPVTDGAVLAHQADGALLVVRAGRTTYDIAEKAIDALAKAKGRALGVVLNGVPLRGVDASPYASAYRYEYVPSTPRRREGVTPEDGAGPRRTTAEDVPLPAPPASAPRSSRPQPAPADPTSAAREAAPRAHRASKRRAAAATPAGPAPADETDDVERLFDRLLSGTEEPTVPKHSPQQ